MKKKGFTLIELLAVIIILGILMLIAIPSVTSYINNSRKETYVSSVKEIIKGSNILVNSGELEINDPEITYYIPSTCVKLENGEVRSPYGKFNPAYVVVTTNKDGYDYYFVGKDYSDIGIPIITRSDIITKESIVSNIEEIDTSIGVEGTTNVVIFSDDCSEIKETKPVTKTVSGMDELSENGSSGTSPSSITPIIYWALQDTDSDGKNDKLVISNASVTGNKDGSFAGDTIFSNAIDIPWGISYQGYTYDGQPSDNASYDVTSVVVEGEVVPKDIKYWFAFIGHGVTSLTMDLKNLKTCNVESMYMTFFYSGHNVTSFNIDISGWDTSNVTSMNSMFYDAGVNASNWSVLGLSNLDTSNVTDMSSVFCYVAHYVPNFNIDISRWNTSKVTRMYGMFECAAMYSQSFDINLGNWDTSNVTDMSYMFSYSAYKATTWSVGDISKWKTSKVTNMSNLFSLTSYSVESFNLDLSKWDVSNVINMEKMFDSTGFDSKSYNLNISGWDTSKVTNMRSMFDSAGYKSNTLSIVGLSNLKTSNVTDMSQMFCEMGIYTTNLNLDLRGWDTSKVTTMYQMFCSLGSYATSIYLNVSDWDIRNVTNMGFIFSSSGSYSTNYYVDISGWDTSKVTNMSSMFRFAGMNATTFNVIIPKTNGNGINNTTTIMYGSSTSYNTSPPEGKLFSLAN